MGEHTKCNFCTLQSIKRRAATTGMTVSVIDSRHRHSSTESEFASKSVYVHTSNRQRAGKDKVAWFAALTDHCVC